MSEWDHKYETWIAEPEIGTDWSSQTWAKPAGWRVQVQVWPATSQWVGFLGGSGTEPTRFCGPKPDRWRVTRTRC